MENKELYAHASAFARVWACPASLRLEDGLPSEASAASEHGEYLHGIMETGLNPDIVSSLSDEEKQGLKYVYERLAEIEHNNGIALEEKRELALEYKDKQCNKLLSGRIDKVCITEDGIDIIDYKFGTLSVESAEKNLQLACYAFLYVANNPELAGNTRVRVHIIAPFAIGKKYSTAFYTVEEIRDIIGVQIIEAIHRAKAENAPFASDVGEHCRYCRAIGICPKQKENAEIVVAEGENTLRQGEFAITQDNAMEVFKQLEEWNKRKLQAEKHVEKVRENLERYVNESKDERFEWKQGVRVIQYTAQDVYSYFKQLIPPDKFIDFCKPQVAKIVDYVSGLSRRSKAQEKKDLDEALLNAGVEVKYNKSKLILKKGE